MSTLTIQLGAIPDWYTTFAVSPLGIIIAFALVVGFGLLASHKG